MRQAKTCSLGACVDWGLRHPNPERSFPSVSPLRLKELKDRGIISEPLVISSTFAGSPLHLVEARIDVSQLGRYGGWRFRGMLESFEQGLSAGRSTTLEIARQM